MHGARWSRRDRAYYALPGPFQDVALSVYGLRNRRRLAEWTETLDSVAASERWDEGRQRAYVSGRLRKLLAHAIRYVPRYAELHALLGEIEDTGNDPFELLQAFPPVSRQDVLASPDIYVSGAFARQRLRRTFTSGTTGTPFATWISPESLTVSDALWWRRTVWAGYEKGDWIARLVGDPVISLKERNPRRVSRRSWTDRRLYFSTYHLSESTAPRIARTLLRRRPAFLMGYPSALDALARLCEGTVDVSDWNPKAVLFSSEPMYEHQREALSRFVDAPIRGLYGCAERVVSAAECPYGSYHLSLVDGYVEGQFDGARVSQPARVTGLLNFAMPLIRYELGDVIEPLPGASCPCGRTLPLISPVVTKAEDSLTTSSGRVISPSVLTWAFKDLVGVKRSQILQHDRSSAEVLVQADPEDFERVQEVLEHRLRELVFGEISLSFRRVESLHSTASGKTHFVRASQRGGPTG